MMQTLINKLREVGWKLLISADVSAKCVKNKDAQYQLGKFQKIRLIVFFIMKGFRNISDCHSIFLIKTENSFFNPGMQFFSPDPPSYFEAMNAPLIC